MSEHPFGIWSFTPPVVAIVLAILTRRIVGSLVAGVFAGALLMAGGNPLVAVAETWETHLWNTLIDPGKLRVFSFTLLMGALVGVITRSGGMRGLIGLVLPWARTRRRGQLTTYLLGLVIFFDDYANTILIGNTMRPISDRLRISREKLAYLVDSTAAPIAGVALISTWIAVELDYIAAGLAAVPEMASATAFGLFIDTLPYRFYVWGALVFVPLTAILGRDFGPMRAAECRAAVRDKVIHASPVTGDPPAEAETGESETGESETGEGGVRPNVDRPDRVAAWYHAAIPLVVTLGLVVYFLLVTGLRELGLPGDRPWQAFRGETPLRAIIGAADSTIALQYGALAGVLLALGMARAGRLMSWAEGLDAATAGARVVLPAIAILWTASSLSRMTTGEAVDGRSPSEPFEFRDHRLYTGDYLALVLAGQSPASPSEENDQVRSRTRDPGRPTVPYSVRWLPTIVFVIAALVAFSTGTSWGTMGILIPMVFPLARGLLIREGLTVVEGEPLLLASVGGVLAGAIFGDHCSPISDTTVLSSQSSGCDHLSHVWTQMPYAMVVGGVSIVLGTIPLGFGFPVSILLPVQFLALLAILWLLGKPTSYRD